LIIDQRSLINDRFSRSNSKGLALDVTINTLSEVQQEADIKVTPEELQPHFEEAYAKYRPKVEIRGFRKGRVPMHMIKRLYGELIEHEAVENIANDLFQNVMEERNIRPLGQPSMVDMDFKRGKYLHFRVKYDVKPQITLQEYKGIAIDKYVHNVSDAELEDELLHLRRIHAVNAEVDTVTDDEHTITADVQEFDDAGTPIVGHKNIDARFTLSDSSLVEELRNALRKAEKGQTCRVSYETKHDEHTHKVNLELSVKKIEKHTLPAFDEELVKKITNNTQSSPEEFQKSMRADLERYWVDRAQSRLDDDIATEVVRRHEFAVPDTLTDAILDSYVDDVKNRSRDKKLPAGFEEAKFREERRANAVWQAKWMLLKNQIAEAEGITVTDDDLTRLAETDAPRMGITVDKLVQYYKSSDRTRERALSDKIVTFLKDNARITEKEVKA
jgi:trigger factor